MMKNLWDNLYDIYRVTYIDIDIIYCIPLKQANPTAVWKTDW